MAKWLKGGSVIGVEMTPSQIKVIEVIPGAQLKLLRAASASYFRGDPSTVGGQLGNLLKQEGFKSKVAHLAISGSSLAHGTILLPALKSSEMQLVVEREFRKLSTLPPADQAVGYQLLGEVTERGIKKNQVLIAGASRSAINQAVGAVEAAGLRVQRISIVPVALHNAILLLSMPLEEGAIAHLKLGLETSYIVILRGNVLQFSREIPLGLRGATEGGAGFSDRLIAEIKRTALYYRQNFRGEEIRRIVLSGDEPDLRRLTGPILDELGIEVSIYDPMPVLDLSALQDGAVKFRDTAHCYSVPLGVTWVPKTGAALNIQYKVAESKVPVRWQAVAALLVLLVLVVAAILGYFYVENLLTQRRDKLAALNSQSQSLQPKIQQIQEEQRLREVQKVRLAFLQGTTQQGPVVAKALQEFSLLVPEEMLFRSVNISKMPDHWQISIDGEVVDQDAPRATALFNRFLAELRGSSFFSGADLLQPLQVSSFDDTSSSTAPAVVMQSLVSPPQAKPSAVAVPAVDQGRSTRIQVPGAINIPVPERPSPAAGASKTSVRRSRVEFKLGVSIAS